MIKRTKVFFDGGCRPNPGAMEIAVVVGGEAIVCRLGAGSSMDAEWLALIHALRMARERGLRDVVLLGDSRAVIDQANGCTAARGGNAAHLGTFRTLTSNCAPPRVRYIKRTQNLAGIALARFHEC